MSRNTTRTSFIVAENQNDLIEREYYENVLIKHIIQSLYNQFYLLEEYDKLNREFQMETILLKIEELKGELEEYEHLELIEPKINDLKANIMEVLNIIEKTNMKEKLNQINNHLCNVTNTLFVSGIDTSEAEADLVQEALMNLVDTMQVLTGGSVKNLSHVVNKENHCRTLYKVYLTTWKDSMNVIMKCYHKMMASIINNLLNSTNYVDTATIEKNIRSI